MIVVNASLLTYRYLRANLTKIIYASATQVPMYSVLFSPDGGTTTYPASTMTNNTTPAPLVASNVAGDANAYKVFDADNTTFVQSAPEFNSQVPPTPCWVQIDLGSGNGILPNAIKIAAYNTGGIDCSWVDFNITGSNTGAFGGEEVTIKSWTAQTTQTHQALVTFT